jgi:hypothetical protein
MAQLPREFQSLKSERSQTAAVRLAACRVARAHDRIVLSARIVHKAGGEY